MNRPMSWNALLQQAATASVVSKPVMKKKAATDAIYGVAEPKRKAQSKNLTDKELQAIWDRNQAKMRSKTATALAQMQRSPQRIPAVPIGRPAPVRRVQLPGILSTTPQSTPMWRIK